MIPESLLRRLERTGVVAVLVIDDPDAAVPLACALRDGGVDCLELTLRTPSALESLKRIRDAVPGMALGVGTILDPQQVRDVAAAGATFGVSPGLNPRVVAEAQKIGLPFAPGVCTPTDIELALELGCRVLKLFPAEACGGITYLKNVAAPFAHLGMRFIPLGGLNAANAASYLQEPSVLALGGSWLAPRDRILAQDWTAITANAREAAGIIARVRGGRS